MPLHFQRQGKGYPLVILHGLLGSLDNWQTVSRTLGASYEVFAVDLPNHGRSPHSEVFSYESIAGELRDFLRVQGIARAHFLGHSLGGKAAMHFALWHPELVEKLTVVDIAPKKYPPLHEPLLDALLALDLASFRERSEVDAALKPAIADAAVRQWLLKNLARDAVGALRWKMNLPVIYRSYGGLNEAIETDRTFAGPVLFIKGGRSDFLAPGDAALIHRLFPRTTIKTIAEAGHWVQADAPEQLADFVDRFLC